jgi:LemA protein
VEAEGAAIQGLTQIIMRAEKYPDLKANQQFQKLSNQITALEDKIAHARGFFNDSVAEYNTQTRVFPASLIARMGKFDEYPLFAAELEEKAVPKPQIG